MNHNEKLKMRCWAACHAGQLEQVKECVAQGCDLNGVVDEINTCLAISVHGGHEDIVRYLLDNGADINDTSQMEACYLGNVEMLKILLKHGADPNWKQPTTGETQLHVAACRGGQSGTTECVRLLLEAGANPNIHTENRVNSDTYGGAYVVGETPLHLAAAFGDNEMIQLLLDAGADPVARDADGHTPRFYFARQQRDQPHIKIANKRRIEGLLPIDEM